MVEKEEEKPLVEPLGPSVEALVQASAYLVKPDKEDKPLVAPLVEALVQTAAYLVQAAAYLEKEEEPWVAPLVEAWVQASADLVKVEQKEEEKPHYCCAA